MGLQRVLGVKRYKTAGRRCTSCVVPWCAPAGIGSREVKVDKAAVAGEEEGVRGRQTEAKALIAIAAEEDGPGIGRIRMRRICDASAENLMPFVEDFIEPGSVVHTDGWLGCLLLLEENCQFSGWRQSRSHGRRGQNKSTAGRGRPTIKR